MDAGAGAGFGTWADKWGETGASKAKLDVPVAAHPDATTYTSELTWTLTDVPAN